MTDAVLDTNVRAPFLLSREVAARLIKEQRGGRMVNISSMGMISREIGELGEEAPRLAAGVLGLVGQVEPVLLLGPQLSARGVHLVDQLGHFPDLEPEAALQQVVRQRRAG